MDQRGRAAITIALCIAIFDAVMKTMASSLPQTTANPVIGFALHKNPGIVFDIPVPLVILAPLSLVIIGVFAFIGGRSHQSLARVGAYVAILGAANNLIDRLVNGFTTDYIILFGTSAINLSDILIVIGTLLLIRYTQHNPSAQET